MSMTAAAHMTFRRLGRSYHLRIADADGLAQAAALDEAHWVATGAPVRGLAADATFLRLLDADGDGRITAADVKGAIRWVLRVLRDCRGLEAGSSTLRLDAVDADDAEGARIARSAEKMLHRLGQGGAGEIALEQIRQIKARVEGSSVSEAGVVLPEAACDDVRAFLADVIATVGGVPHPGGGSGVDADRLGEFFTQARAHLDWRARGELGEGQSASPVMPLGADTPAAFAVYAALRDKLDEYFAQCEAVAFDGRAAGRVGVRDEQLQALELASPRAVEEFLLAAPLARPRADGVLDLREGVNPAYAGPLGRLREEVLPRVLGEAGRSLSGAQWRQVREFFAAHEAWLAARAGGDVEPLGPEKLARYLDGHYRAAVEALIADSARTAFDLDNIRLTEKAALYQAHLLELANNFVSFPHLYDPARRALFETGTLVMDGRRLNLAVRVDDRNQHAAVARSGNMYVLYVEVSPAGEPKFEVAVPVTAGGRGNLCAGKRGVLQDVRGREHPACVVQVIENPISVGEAFAAPFQRIARLLTGKIEAMTASAEKDLDAATATAFEEVKEGAPPRPAPAQGRGLLAGGLVMGGGVAVAALGSALAFITKTLADVEVWKIVLGVALAALAVILPTSLLALVKLRRRDLSAILEGSGWAINARMRLTRRQRRYFTHRPRYPRGSRGLWRGWLWAVVIVAALAVAGAVGAYFRWR